MNKLKKTNLILDYFFKNQYIKLNEPTLKKIIEIDDEFDINRFDIKRIQLSIFYSMEEKYNWRTKTSVKIGNIKMLDMNTSNCNEFRIYNMSGFRINGKSKIETDLNIFFRNLDNITTIFQDVLDFKTKKTIKNEYQVKYLHSKKNIKTFRFVLHSYVKKAHNLEMYTWRDLKKYYINGNSIEKKLWIKYSREYKLNRILKK